MLVAGFAYHNWAVVSLFVVGFVLFLSGVLLAQAQHARWERNVPHNAPEQIYAYLHTAPKWGLGQSLSLTGLVCIAAGILWLGRITHTF